MHAYFITNLLRNDRMSIGHAHFPDKLFEEWQIPDVKKRGHKAPFFNPENQML
jgi:hypothetical protein